MDWQLVIALLCVAVAMLAVGRRAVNLIRGNASSGSCGTGCGSCPSNGATTGPPAQLVSLKLPD